jgi:RNA polymerase sigma-70 factor (ECF subfamily)
MADPVLVRQFLEQRDVILGFILALTRDYDTAEEVLQEVALVILDEANKGTVASHFPSWAQGIARRRVADHYRKRNRRHAVEQVSGAMTEVVCQAFAENEELLDRHQDRMKALMQCLTRLTGRSRDVIVGFYQQRLSIQQLAETLAWQANSVKVALTRARKLLADCIQVRLRTDGQES